MNLRIAGPEGENAPKEAKKPVHRVVTIALVQLMYSVLDDVKDWLAAPAGMRPGEIFAMKAKC